MPTYPVTVGLLHRFPNRDHVQRKCHGCLGVDDPFEWTPMTGYMRGDSDPYLVLSALHGAAGRRANRSRRIEVGKAHAVLGQLIDVGRIDEIVSVTAEVSPSEVVDEYEDERWGGLAFPPGPSLPKLRVKRQVGSFSFSFDWLRP